MARKPGSSPSAIKSRAARTAAALSPAGGAPAAAATPKKKRMNPVQFFREVRAEARKITWTTRKETWITSVMVFMMVVLAAIFFSAVDGLLGLGAKALLSFAAG